MIVQSVNRYIYIKLALRDAHFEDTLKKYEEVKDKSKLYYQDNDCYFVGKIITSIYVVNQFSF